MTDNTERDVLIIGGGPAGLSGALTLSRARRTVTVVDAGEPRNATAEHMHGFLTRDGMPPALLLETGRTEVRGYGGEIVEGGSRARRAPRRASSSRWPTGRGSRAAACWSPPA